MNKKPILIILLVYLFANAIFYTPYILKHRWSVIERNWDGPAFIIIAKTLYNPKLIKKENYIHKYLPDPITFTEKFPVYPLFIRLFSFMTYDKSMIFTSLLFGYLSLVAFYFTLRHFQIKHSLLLSLIFIFFPPRWFTLQKVGALETTLAFFSLLSVLFFYKKKYLASSIFLTLATLSRVNGLLILISFLSIIAIFRKKDVRKMIFFFLPIIGAGLLFFYYQFHYGNFWVYFESDRRCFEQLSLFKYPYSIFDASACFVGTIYLEEAICFFAIGYLAILTLIKTKNWEFLTLFLPSFIPMLFLRLNDFSRYGIFVYFLLGIIFAKYLLKKEALIIFLLLIPAIYLYARNFVNVNIFIP